MTAQVFWRACKHRIAGLDDKLLEALIIQAAHILKFFIQFEVDGFD